MNKEKIFNFSSLISNPFLRGLCGSKIYTEFDGNFEPDSGMPHFQIGTSSFNLEINQSIAASPSRR